MAIDILGANALANNSVTTAKIAADAVTTAKIAAGAVVASDVADGSVTTAKLADNAVTSAKALNLGRRNLIINGGFDVWQRGTSFSDVNDVYTADRMYVVAGGGTTGDNVTQQAFTVGQTDVPGEPTYYFRFTAGSTSSNKVVHHRIEDVRTGAGQTVTLSFWGKASTSHSSTIELGQNFGSGGSSQVVPSSQSYSLTTSWQKFTFNIVLPSISGKTIGTSSYLYIAFIRSLPASNVDIDIAQMQLEIGDAATDFEHRSYGEELAACQRYFEKKGQSSTSTAWAFYEMNAVIAQSTNYVQGDKFKVEKRADPTLVFYSRNGTSGKISLFNTGADATGSWTQNAKGATGFHAVVGPAASITKGDGYEYGYTADAEL